MDGSMGPCLHDPLHLLQDPADPDHDLWQRQAVEIRSSVSDMKKRGCRTKKVRQLSFYRFESSLTAGFFLKKEEPDSKKSGPGCKI
jgi:hypothetical protein